LFERTKANDGEINLAINYPKLKTNPELSESLKMLCLEQKAWLAGRRCATTPNRRTALSVPLCPSARTARCSPLRSEQGMGQDTDVTAVPVPFPTYRGKARSISYHRRQSTNVDVLMATTIPAAGV